MKSFLALFALVAVAAADVSHIKSGESEAEILAQQSDVYPDQYQYGYQTSNGIQAQESGALKQVGNDAAIAVSGSNVFTAPDGQVIEISYTADENGYQPKGAHLPTPPPIPELIQRSLSFILANPPKAEPSNNKF